MDKEQKKQYIQEVDEIRAGSAFKAKTKDLLLAQGQPVANMARAKNPLPFRLLRPRNISLAAGLVLAVALGAYLYANPAFFGGFFSMTAAQSSQASAEDGKAEHRQSVMAGNEDAAPQTEGGLAGGTPEEATPADLPALEVPKTLWLPAEPQYFDAGATANSGRSETESVAQAFSAMPVYANQASTSQELYQAVDNAATALGVSISAYNESTKNIPDLEEAVLYVGGQFEGGSIEAASTGSMVIRLSNSMANNIAPLPANNTDSAALTAFAQQLYVALWGALPSLPAQPGYLVQPEANGGGYSVVIYEAGNGPAYALLSQQAGIASARIRLLENEVEITLPFFTTPPLLGEYPVIAEEDAIEQLLAGLSVPAAEGQIDTGDVLNIQLLYYPGKGQPSFMPYYAVDVLLSNDQIQVYNVPAAQNIYLLWPR